MKKFFFLLMNIFIFQIISAVESINPPFISKLTFEVSNTKVLLNWQNPPTFNEYISIFRSKSIIDNTSKLLKSERIAILANKENKYIDSPKEYGDYYYALIITEKTTKYAFSKDCLV